jgi:23S rRNA G2445 N2-methylase RlmL
MLQAAANGFRVLDELRLIGAGGTNKVMAGELSRLARRALQDVRLPEPRKAGTGALIYPFDARVAKVAALYHRTCVRVLWDVMETSAARLEPLFADLVQAGAACVKRFLWDGARLSVYAHGVQEFAAGERQVVGTVKNALIEAAALQGMHVSLEPDAPDIVFAVRGDEGVMRVSIDLAGRPMNQRGYRQERAQAPLREDLAAVLLMLARYDARSELLVDPMAGSGTIAIEAACMASARPVWVAPRRALLLGMPAFADVPPLGESPLFADTQPCVIASDVDPYMKPITEQAAQRAGVAESLHVLTSDFRALTPERIAELAGSAAAGRSRGLVISNPPYGERLDDPELERLYQDLGRFCARLPGWRAAFLVANRSFERAFGGRPRVKKPLSNGPLHGYFYLYDL